MSERKHQRMINHENSRIENLSYTTLNPKTHDHANTVLNELIERQEYLLKLVGNNPRKILRADTPEIRRFKETIIAIDEQIEVTKDQIENEQRDRYRAYNPDTETQIDWNQQNALVDFNEPQRSVGGRSFKRKSSRKHKKRSNKKRSNKKRSHKRH